MATAVTLALSLAFEPPESKVMQRPPRRADEPMLTPYLLWRVVLVAMILMVGTFGLFTWYIKQGFPIEYARTVAVNTLVMFIIIKIAMASHFHHDLVFEPLCFVLFSNTMGPLVGHPYGWLMTTTFKQTMNGET